MNNNRKTILLVEDNANDEYLTLRALKKYNVANDVIVARDGVEALDYLLCTGPHANRDPWVLPIVVLLDLSLPKVDGLEVLRLVPDTQHTWLLPVVIPTCSK